MWSMYLDPLEYPLRVTKDRILFNYTLRIELHFLNVAFYGNVMGMNPKYL